MSKRQKARKPEPETPDRVKEEPEDCRCKEVSKKTPRQLLRVVLDDLSFWKRK